MIIKVTQQDLDEGCRGRSSHCPIALALLRETGVAFRVFHGGAIWSAFINHDDDMELPPKAVRAMRRIDRGLKVRPFSFDLDFEPTEV